MFDWEEGDRFSFEDSERFEEDSLCSWISEPESLCNNWRGWRRPGNNSLLINYGRNRFGQKDGKVMSLTEMCARTIAAHIPFEVVEQMMPPVPEQLQLQIAFWSFPENEEDIRLYSCLANGNAEEFTKGENLYKHRSVHDPLQIGFHLCATVIVSSGTKGQYNVAVTFDRGRITTCNCTCTSTASWCSHVVAVCLHRIHQHNTVKLRAPVSESLSRLQRDQLQKFAQYLISELPQQILPTAQRLIDEILSSQPLDINTVSGAPDPTAGASIYEQTAWWLDENNLHENIRKILVKFCVPSPIVFSDVNYLSTTAPPVAAEWASLLRPLRGREPEGMWNLLSIVREMFKRNDRNAIPLLDIITEECLATDKILGWWVNTKVALHVGHSGHGGKNNMNSNSHGSQYACSSLCDEIVLLWKLAALNPALSPQEREQLIIQFKEWHLKVLDKVAKNRDGSSNNGSNKKNNDAQVFPGFKLAIEACLLDWNDYFIPGVTYSQGNSSLYYCPVMCFRQDSSTRQEAVSGQVSSAHVRKCDVVIGGIKRPIERRVVISPNTGDHDGRLGNMSHQDRLCLGQSGNRSSVSSEGFCDQDLGRDSDSGQDRSPQQGDSGQVSRQNSREDRPLGAEALVVNNVSYSDERDKSSPEDLDVLEWSVGAEASGSGWRKSDNRNRRSGVRYSSADRLVDEYDLYCYNANMLVEVSKASESSSERNDSVFSGIKKLEDPLEILFARAEGLHAHGHVKEASCLAVQLAQELLANPPNLMVEIPQPQSKSKRKKVNPASHQISCLASATLAKCAFLCTVLAENPKNTYLAFQVAMFGLEMARPPASTKPLEVKLANQESDLVALLKRLPLGPAELSAIRDKAEQLRSSTLKSRGEALLPLMLAQFIFEALVMPGSSNRGGNQSYRQPQDETLGFEGAVAAIGMKANVCEADHPLLCEGTRRQRGELALTLLCHYKDDKEKLARIMDKLLDKEVHQMYKAPSLPTHYASHTPTTQANVCSGQEYSEGPSGVATVTTGGMALGGDPSSMGAVGGSSLSLSPAGMVSPSSLPGNGMVQTTSAGARMHTSLPPPTQPLKMPTPDYAVSSDMEQALGSLRLSPSQTLAPESSKETSGMARFCESAEGECNPSWEEEYKAWQEKFHCSKSSKQPKKHGSTNSSSSAVNAGPCAEGARAIVVTSLAGIDPSVNETTSSDNSPTLVRRATWMKATGPGSDSGSSGNSSDSIRSSSSGDKMNKPVESPPLGYHLTRPVPQPTPESVAQPRPPLQYSKGMRFKGKRAYPTVPNQPSEAGSYFMFELAKTVLNKAGGNSSTSLFTQPSNSQNHRGPHRALHMCAFQIGLYALGLHNCVTPNWLSRTYSSHVSWIANQAVEIGAPAVSFLIDTWEGHLTPQEAAAIADGASRGRDSSTIRSAARLALSCLPHAHALNPNEIQRAIIQCKEQSEAMLENACLAVESAAKGGGVYPEVLFSVARRWHELYEAHAGHTSRGGQGGQELGVAEHGTHDLPPPPVPQDLPLPPPPRDPASSSSHTSSQHVDNSTHATLQPSVCSAVSGSTSSSSSSGVTGYAIAATGGAPTAPAVPYGLPTVPYHLGYNYVQSLPPGVPCLNPQVPVQMYIQPSGVQFNSAQALLPPPALQYYPQVSIPSSLAQGGVPGPVPNSIAGQQPIGAQVSLAPPTIGQQPPLAQGATPPPQGFYHLQYSGAAGVSSAGFVPAPRPALLPFVRTQGPPLVQPPPHQPPLPPHSTAQPQQQVRGLVGGQASGSGSVHYLLSAYRVGMLALETLARRVHDDRPQAKYARNPPYGEDVKWLLGIAKKLGTHYLHQFCLSSVNSVMSPFVLQDLAVEAAQYLSRHSPGLFPQHLRSPILQPLVQKCQQMFIQCTHMKMYYITPTEYDEIITIIRAARSAFQMTPGGMVQFNDLLNNLRRSKSCKKELWQRIASALQQTPSL
ncbi:zinc finger SWIM domain-containing dorado isoform X2 [Oratosquilla oratoria]|uniref:zinc finger SWIM domain-containing dorado isoform X2 n=1 Tax=Oratosquilla oratoria TaxID=337810 RepID=UPI003F76F5A0